MRDNIENAFVWVGYLHCHGLTIKEENGKLHVNPSELITPYARNLIQRRKAEIINVFKTLKEDQAAALEAGSKFY